MDYIIGQRWVSHADAQLGLGIVVDIDGRRVTLAFPAVEDMTTTQALWGAALLAGPGPFAWLITMRRWRIERARAAEHLDGSRPW